MTIDVSPEPGNDNRDRLVDAVLWAAGSDRPLPDLAALPVDLLAEGLGLHRLDARILERASREGVALPDDLRERVTARHRDNVARMHHHLALFRRVRDRLEERAPGTGLVPLKGFGLFALSGDEVHTAFSHDVDVLGGDPRAVADAVESLEGSGYHFHGEEHPYVFAHMDEVEVHARYIVTAFPREASGTLLDVTRDGGRGRIPGPFRAAVIQFDDVAPLLVPGVGAAEGIAVPRPELALLIRCAHVYVGFAMNTQPIPWATVRLEELAQMRDLLARPEFDDVLFSDLCKRFEGDLVTDFARHLHVALLGTDPFERLGACAQEPRELFPRNLWWDGSASGFPVQMPWRAEDVVRYGDRARDLVDVLGATEVTLGDGVTVPIACGEDVAGEDAARYLWHAFGGGCGPLSCDLAPVRDGLRLDVTFPAVDDSRMAAVGWASGQFRYEVFFRPADGTFTFDDYSDVKAPEAARPRPVACERLADGRVRISIEAPWPSLGRRGRSGRGALPLVLRARVQDRPWGAVAGGAVVPLRVAL